MVPRKTSILSLLRHFYDGEGVFFCIKITNNIDSARGSGGMFIQSGDFVNLTGMNANSSATFYGQEKVAYNAQLCLMNMAIPDLASVIRSGDEANTCYHNAHNWAENCDCVMANPPFNVDKVKTESTSAAGQLLFGLPSVNKIIEVSKRI